MRYSVFGYIAFSIILFFILVYGFSKIAGPLPFSVNSTVTNKSEAFSVSGEGESSLKPDIAKVSVGVQATGSTVKATQDQLNTNINAVSEAIKKLGVDQKDIKTSNYNISPQQDYSSGKPRITGYSASSELVVTIRQLDKVNEVIDQSTAAGANTLGNVSFDLSDKTKAQDEARQKAVEDAKNRAEQAAKTAGFRLGKLVNYSESFDDQSRPVPMMLDAQVKSTNPTQVEPGTTDTKVIVTLSYEIF